MTENLMLELYQAFEDSRAAFTGAGVPPIEFVDRMRGQPLNPEQYEYFPLPAIFISRSVQWARKDNGAAGYNGAMSLEFHLVTEPMGEASNLAVGKAEALKYHRLVNQVRSVLDNFSSERVSGLDRGTDREMDTGVIVYEVLGYTCTYFEDEPAIATAEPEAMEVTDVNLVKVLRRH